MRKLHLGAIFFIAISIAVPYGSCENISPVDILKAVYYNQSPNSVNYNVKMIIHQNMQDNVKEFILYGEGMEKSYVWFQSPKRDYGTAILRLADNLWIYYPSAERTLKLSGNMLRQSFMGSDFSLEDSTDRFKLLENYDVSLIGTENLDNRPTYVLNLMAKEPKATYFRRKLWVDTEQLIISRQEMYAKSGKLLKIKFAQEVQQIKGRYFETKVRMEDKLKHNTFTEMIFTNIILDEPIPASTFSMQNLEKKH
jgi:outer membrane lipoprotein-sorting protein